MEKAAYFGWLQAAALIAKAAQSPFTLALTTAGGS